MDDNTLIKLALIIGVFGIIMLYFVSSITDIENSSIGKLNQLDDSQSVKVEGKITKIIKKDKVTYLELLQEETVKIIVFNDRNLSLKNNELVEITGKISENNNENEIIADKIILLR